MSFDGFILEIFGMSDAVASQRYIVDQVERIGIADGKGEVMLLAKLPRGKGLGLAFSEAKRDELVQLVAAVEQAKGQTG